MPKTRIRIGFRKAPLFQQAGNPASGICAPTVPGYHDGTMSTQFQTAAVIGTGMMGPGIALTLALGGVRATIIGRTAVSAVAGMDRARAQGRTLAENDLVSREQMDAAFARLNASPDFDGSVDLVVESAPENMEFKQDLFARLDADTRPDTVLASNTS